MNNLPENENNLPLDEMSTVFSAPVEHKTTAAKGKKNRFKIVLASLLVVAILFGGTAAVIKFIPEREDGDDVGEAKIELLNYESDDIKQISIKNKNGNFKMLSEIVEEQPIETSEEPIKKTVWYLDGYKKDLTDSSLIENVVDATIDISAIREITSKTAKECGLEKPAVKVDITTKDKEKVTVLVGDKSPDNAGAYVKLSTKDGIYLVGGYIDETLSFADLDLASTEAVPAITLGEKYKDYYAGDDLVKFDTLAISGVNFKDELIFVENDNELLSAYMPYIVTSPTNRTAENVDMLFMMFSNGFNVSGAYSYDASDETLKSLGLDKPDLVLSAKFDDYTYSYKFKKQDDGYYAVVGSDSENVRRVSTEDCGFLESTTVNYYSKLVFMTQIDNVKMLSLKTADKTYDFSIVANPTADEYDKYIVECDGKSYNSSYFQSFYQYLCMIEYMDFNVEKVSNEPELTITYAYNQKSNSPTVIDYVKISATKYQCRVDGVPLGNIGSSTYKKILTNLERLLDGKTVVVN